MKSSQELLALSSFSPVLHVCANLHARHLKASFYFIFSHFSRLYSAQQSYNSVAAMQQLLIHANVYANKILFFGVVNTCITDLKDFWKLGSLSLLLRLFMELLDRNVLPVGEDDADER